MVRDERRDRLARYAHQRVVVRGDDLAVTGGQEARAMPDTLSLTRSRARPTAPSDGLANRAPPLSQTNAKNPAPTVTSEQLTEAAATVRRVVGEPARRCQFDIRPEERDGRANCRRDLNHAAGADRQLGEYIAPTRPGSSPHAAARTRRVKPASVRIDPLGTSRITELMEPTSETDLLRSRPLWTK